MSVNLRVDACKECSSSSPDPQVQPVDATSTEQHVVILVHGTKLPRFRKRDDRAEDWPWIDARSDFRIALEPHLKGTVIDDEFRGSEANSYNARLEAGEELATHLKKRHAEHSCRSADDSSP